MKLILILLGGLILGSCSSNRNNNTFFSFHLINYSYPFNSPSRENELSVEINFSLFEEREPYTIDELTDASIQITIQNDSKEDMNLGYSFKLERYADNSWNNVNVLFDEDGSLINIQPGSQEIFTMYLMDYFIENDELRGGSYRAINNDIVTFYFSIGEFKH